MYMTVHKFVKIIGVIFVSDKKQIQFNKHNQVLAFNIEHKGWY